MSTADSEAFRQVLLQMRKTYLDELPEKLDGLEGLLLEIERNGSDTERFDELYRAVHSLKGSAGTFGLAIVTTICHQLEDLLTATDRGSKFAPALVSATLRYLDLLRLAAEQCVAGHDSFPQIDEELEKLRKRDSESHFAVLLVDNSELSARLYEHVLSALPLQISIERDGIDGLTRAVGERFDMVITRLDLPRLNGIALIAALRRSDGASRHAKTILITSTDKSATARLPADPDYAVLKGPDLPLRLLDAARRALSLN